MATGGLYGQSSAGIVSPQSGSESSGLYGNNTVFGGSYFEWFIFQVADVQPATPTGGSWDFTTNTGAPPSGWLASPPANPTNTVWVSVGVVSSKNNTAIVWSEPGKFSFASGLPILSGTDAPTSGDGQSDQLYIETGTTPETIWFKQAGTWTRLTGSSLYMDLTSNQTIGGTKTFSSEIQGSVSGTSSNVTGIVDITHGGTGSTDASSARTALGVTATGSDTTYAYRANNLSDLASASTARTNLGLGSAAVLTAGAANGVATLDSGGTVPLSQIPASIQGGVSYQGTWNATTNSPTLTSSVGTKGYYYVVSTAGSTNLNGITSWNIGDWAIFNGTTWEKIDNTDAVTSVNGYTGTVVLTYDDILSGNINNAPIGSTTRASIAGTTELIGPSASANFTRFPNALSVVSNIASGVQHDESLYIGQMSEATSVGSTWGSGVYGAGYTNASGSGRGTGVTGEGHVSTAADTGVAVGVRGYAKDVHTGNYNIGLYGDAENGDAGLTYGGNVALFLANGNIVTSSAAEKTWYLGGKLTFNGAYDVTIPQLKATTISTGSTVIETTSTDAALRITQLGTGNALLVEDSSNPDSSPFVIDTTGNVLVGLTTAQSVNITGTTVTSALQLFGTSANKSSLSLHRAQASSAGPNLVLNKSRGSTEGDVTAVVSGDAMGSLIFQGADGTNSIVGARITAEVDGTPGTNDMPGRLVFSTTADGASSPTERMRITSAGWVGIGTLSPAANLNVQGGQGTTLRLGCNASISTQIESALEFYAFDSSAPAGASVRCQIDSFGNANGGASDLRFLTNDGTLTERMRIDSAGQVTIGGTSTTGVSVYLRKNVTGGTTAYGLAQNVQIQSDVTSSANLFSSVFSTAASAFTLTNVNHFVASQSTIGAGSAVTNQYGFLAGNSLTGATNNYGFYGNIDAGTNRYNFYAAGTAINFFAGAVGIGTTTVGAATGYTVRVGGLATGATGWQSVGARQVIQSDVTAAARSFISWPETAASAFTLNELTHFYANQGNIGAGSTVTSQYGFYVSNSLTGATNNYGFHSNIAAGTGRWNFYANGTANNYFAGNVGIGTSSPSTKLNVSSDAPVFRLTDVDTALSDGELSSGIEFYQSDSSGAGVGASIGAYGQGTTGLLDLRFATGANTERMRINSAGEVGIGAASAAGYNILSSKNLTGASNTIGIASHGSIQSDASSASMFRTSPTVAAAAFTLTNLNHYVANQSTIGAGATVATQIGFRAESTLTGATNNYGFHSNIAAGTGRWNFYANGTANNYFAGNVGIGTSSPSTKIHAYSSAGNSYIQAARETQSTGEAGYQINGGTGGTDWYMYQPTSSNNLQWYGNGATRMVLDSSGNLLVGTTSGNGRIGVAVADGSINAFYAERTGGAPATLAVNFANAYTNFNSSVRYQVVAGGSGGVYLGTGATSWASASDQRIKTTLTPFENAAAKVSTLRAGTGRYLTDEETISRSFLIAQDVQAVLPEAVDVQDDEQGTLGLRYTDLIPLLTAAIQEQQAIIESLKARLDAANL